MISLDAAHLKRLQTLLAAYPRQAPTACARAINDGLAAARTTTWRALKDNFTIKGQRNIYAQIRLERASPGKIEGRFLASGRPISLAHFRTLPNIRHSTRKSKPPRWQLETNGPWHTAPGTFKHNGQIFGRRGKRLISYGGYSVPKMLENVQALETVEQAAMDRIAARIDHHLHVE